MTLNVVLLKPDFVICALDRRLTAPDGCIVTERSNKVTHFVCLNARGFITYNGIGWDQYRKTPSDWLMEIDNLDSMDITQVIDSIRNLATKKLLRLPKSYQDRRHTFIICGFGAALPTPLPFWVSLSNYENSRKPIRKLDGIGEFTESILAMPDVPQTLGKAWLIAGATDLLSAKHWRIAVAAARACTDIVEGKRLAERIIRFASFARGRRGSVGTTVTWGTITSSLETNVGQSTIGKTTMQELPNVIWPGGKLKDGYSSTEGFQFQRTGYGMRIVETPCKNCRNPIPPGNACCGACGRDQS